MVLVKAILQLMPLYLFSVLATPKWVLKRIKNLQRNFLWGSSGQNRKWALVKWMIVCLPKNTVGWVSVILNIEMLLWEQGYGGNGY